MSGGDLRLNIDEIHLLNKYGCRPFPRPDAFTFASSTASSSAPCADHSFSLLFLFLRSALALLSYFFFLMFPPPPPSTLFPYTTLFRSPYETIDPISAAGILRRFHRRPDLRVRIFGHTHRRIADRKSTRLNSSHLGISYAVFCLKKKKSRKKKTVRENCMILWLTETW